MAFNKDYYAEKFIKIMAKDDENKYLEFNE
jgi:hypothetical protein